ncbi:MAG: hypothetical protein NZZ41_04185 [Candidatus Dojkabacteria bacterium]|nr:hypothetical protein [Candidatus Dojkabacteria bacterium]
MTMEIELLKLLIDNGFAVFSSFITLLILFWMIKKQAEINKNQADKISLVVEQNQSILRDFIDKTQKILNELENINKKNSFILEKIFNEIFKVKSFKKIKKTDKIIKE